MTVITNPIALGCLRRIAEVERAVNEDLADVREELRDIAHREKHGPPESAGARVNKKRALDSLTAEERQRCDEVFKNADRDGSQKVGVLELRGLLEQVHGKPVPEGQFQQMMMQYDTNRDGEMDFEEFLVCFAYTDDQKKAHFQAQGHSDLTDDIDHVTAAEEQELERKVKIEGVPMSLVTRYLRKELDETAACLQLPQAMCIFFMFTVAVLIHYKFAVLHAVDQAITWDVEQNANFAFSGIVPFEGGRMGHKSIYDVNSIPDFWSWFSMGLAPLFWPGGWDVNEVRGNTGSKCGGAQDALDGFGSWKSSYLSGTRNNPILSYCPEQDGVTWKDSARTFFGLQGGAPLLGDGVEGNYLLFHSIVGGVRLRQERVNAIDCTAPNKDVRQALHRGRCKEYANDYLLMPELTRAMGRDKSKLNQPGGETVYLKSRMSVSEVREKLREMENRVWFSPRTNKVEITFITYNPHQDLITACYIFFFLNIGGHIHKIVEPVSFFLHPYVHWYDFVFDIMWIILILKIFFLESLDLVRHWCQLGFLKGTYEYGDFVNFVDWTSIVYAFFLIAVNIVQLYRLKDLAEIMKTGSPLLSGTFGSDAARSDFFEQVDEIVGWTLTIRTMLAVYPYVIVSRFFKAFASQPRLAMVTNTLISAANDIIHFVVVFATVFTVYTLVAIILWGQEEEDFANFGRAFHTVFRIMLGDFDWEELREVGRPQAYIWFWTFQWLVVLIMLNMLLAIIMDVYTEVKSHIGRAETLWSQTYEIYRRSKDVRLGRAKSLKYILKMLDPTDLVDDDEDGNEDEPVRIETLVQEHKLSEHQALDVLMEAQRLHEIELMADRHSQGQKSIRRINIRVTQMHGFLERYMNRGAYGGEFSSTPSVTI